MAEQVLTDFIRALRSADVRVSTGEAIDAAEAVKLIGYSDRQRLLDTLRCVLAKSPAEKLAHDRLYDLYFSRQQVPQSEPPAQEDNSDSDSSDGEGPGDLLDLLLGQFDSGLHLFHGLLLPLAQSFSAIFHSNVNRVTDSSATTLTQ